MDRRALRRRETLDEILDRAMTIMAVDGVAGLSMTKLARAMTIQPPSLYKYFDSALAVYDALFRRGQQQNLDVLRDAMEPAPAGLARVAAGLDATARWAVLNPVLAQLLFWRPVPGFEPTADAFAPTVAVVDLLRSALGEAADLGEIGHDAASDAGMALLSTMHFGVISQHLANEPHLDWEQGRFTTLHPRVVGLFVQAYPPDARRTARRRGAPVSPAVRRNGAGRSRSGS